MYSHDYSNDSHFPVLVVPAKETANMIFIRNGRVATMQLPFNYYRSVP